MEGGKFDFKKAQRELIRKELRPILYEHGFVLCGPTVYIRERSGLLQEFYFKVEVSKLRPWVSYRPVFERGASGTLVRMGRAAEKRNLIEGFTGVISNTGILRMMR